MSQKTKQNSVSSHAGLRHDSADNSVGAARSIPAASVIRASILALVLLSILGSGSARSSVAVAFTVPPSVAASASFPVEAAPSPSSTPATQPQLTLTPSPTSICAPAWSVVTSPNVSGEYNNLYGIGAVSPNDVWAVGYHSIPLIEHWDGAQWSVHSQGVCCGGLLDVSVVSANDVWAIGALSGGGQGGTLTMHWDGTIWSVIPSPQFDLGSRLNGVAAVSANDVWAVGYYNVPGIYARTLIIHWDGAQWSVVPSSNIDDNSNYLFDVDAISANDVWAVGLCFVCKGVSEGTLTMHWDGVSWQTVDSPDMARHNRLLGVAAVSTNDVWAVGGSQAGPPTMHWNGSEWRVIPNSLSLNYSLQAVAAHSTDDVWAVGQGGTSHIVTLTMHWNGSEWRIVPSPSPGGGGNYLRDVAPIAENDVWAVGNQRNSYFETLIERYSDPYVTPSPSPTLTLTSTPGVAPTSTPTSSPTPVVASTTATATATATAATATAASTNTPTTVFTAIVTGTVTATITATRTPTPCSITFTDVQPTDYFHAAIQHLYCAGVVSGYEDNTFRPYNHTTRGQLCKIIVLTRGWSVDCPPTAQFSDAPPSHPFYCYVETAYAHGVVAGYADSTFRPGNDVTRGQLCKIVQLSFGWPDNLAGAPHFADVSDAHPFYRYIETCYNHNVITGYSDNAFRPGNSATRGQICKIVYNATTQP